MINKETGSKIENACDLKYLTEMMGNKKHLIKGIMDAFLEQIPEEMKALSTALEKTDYAVIKNLAHTMKSSVSIMGITVLTPILKEMETLAGTSSGIEKLRELNLQLCAICKQAMEEIESEKNNYI